MLKKTTSLICLIIFVFNIIFINNAFTQFTGGTGSVINGNLLNEESINTPVGKTMGLIYEYLIKDESGYGNQKRKPGLKYNEIIEKQLKILAIENFKGKELAFKNTYLGENYYDFKTNQNLGKNDIPSLQTILEAIPKSQSKYSVTQNLFDNDTFTDQLLSASFGINFNSPENNTLISAIESEIQRFKNQNSRLPTHEELYNITIFSNYKNETIGNLKGNFEYLITPIQNSTKLNRDINSTINTLSKLDKNIIKELDIDISIIKNQYTDYDKIVQIYNKYPELTPMIDGLLQDYEYKLSSKNTIYTLSGAYENIYAVTGLKLQNQAKDYKTLLGNKEVKNIPEIYKKIPQNSIFIHIKNPKFIFEQLEEKDSFLDKAAGKNFLKIFKESMIQWLEINDYENLKNNLNNELIVVLNNLDLTTPNISLIISEKDKAILVPGRKPKAAITKDGKIYIANTKKLLENFTNIDEKDSIYNSDDFKYLWDKKQYSNDEIFIFAGDGFFEKMTSLENYVKMKRKINDYLNLVNLQTLIWAYTDLKGEKINSFEQIKGLLDGIGISENDLNGYVVKDSIITNERIGKVDDVLNIEEISYDLNKISSSEIEGYKSDILLYKEIWRNGFDPLGISIKKLGDGFDIDFYMSPLPQITRGELSFFKSILSDIGINDIKFLSNEKLRIGGLGLILGFDVKKLKDKISQNYEDRELQELKDGIQTINNEFLGGKDFLDYLGGEILLGLGGIDKDLFEGRNTDKIDAFIGIKFVSQDKAKEFIDLMKNAIVKYENSFKRFLINPLISEYNGQKIYKMPIKDFFEINICYTFIDDTLYIGLNESTIKKIIDNSVTPSNIKKEFIKNSNSSGNKSFVFYFIKDELKDSIKNIIDSGKADLLKFTDYFKSSDSYYSPINRYISNYYNDLYYAKLLNTAKPKLEGNFGIINLKNKDDILLLSIDKSAIKLKNNVIKQEFEGLLKNIDAGYLSPEGKDISMLLKDERNWNEIVTINTINNFTDGNEIESLIKNFMFSFDVGDNEINIKIKTYGKINSDKSNEQLKEFKEKILGKDGKNQQIVFLIIGLSIIAISLMIYIFRSTKKNNE